MQLAFWSEHAHCPLMSKFSSTSMPKSFSSGCSQPIYLPVCNDIGDCPDSTVGPCTRPCWISWDSYVPTSLNCQGPPGRQLFPQEYHLHLSALCHLQICWLSPITYVTEEIWNSIVVPSMDPWGGTTHFWFQVGHWAIDYNSLGTAIQLIPYSSHSPSLKLLSLKFSSWDAARHHIKEFAEMQVHYICSSSFFHWCGHFVGEGS